MTILSYIGAREIQNTGIKWDQAEIILNCTVLSDSFNYDTAGKLYLRNENIWQNFDRDTANHVSDQCDESRILANGSIKNFRNKIRDTLKKVDRSKMWNFYNSLSTFYLV